MILAVALVSISLLQFPVTQDSYGADGTYTVTLLKYDRFELRDGEGDDSEAFPNRNGVYSFNGITTAYVAFKDNHSHETILGIIIDNSQMSMTRDAYIDRDMTIFPVEKLEGSTITTEGNLESALYIATPDNKKEKYTASVEFPNSGGQVDIAAHVSGVTIAGQLSTNKLNVEITDEIGYRGTIPATMTLHTDDTVQWYKIFFFNAGPLVDAN
jgi:hypothetical protein